VARNRVGRWATVVGVLIGLVIGTAWTAQAAPTALAASTEAIAAKYAATGGPAGPLGAATDVVTCSELEICGQHFEHGRITWWWTSGALLLSDPAITAVYDGSGGDGGLLGLVSTDTFCGLRDGGCGQHFDHGSIYRSAHTPAVVVEPIALQSWGAMGWEGGRLGYPTSAKDCNLIYNMGCLQRFQGGNVYWSQYGQGAVYGVIADAWAATGWERGQLGFPVGEEFCGLRNGGCAQHFQGGSIYSSPAGTFVMRHEVRDGWAAHGWENGPLGYPVGNSFCQLYGGGCGQHFQGGSVYWSPSGGAHVVWPAARGLWAATGWERGPLGYPAGEQFGGLRDGGWGQHFTDGSLYVSPAGAFVVRRELLDRWAALGWENGPLGYPTSSSYCGLTRGGCGQHFQGGDLYDAPNGTFVVADGRWHGAVQQRWAAAGWENGALGYPTSDTFCGLRDGGCGQHFDGLVPDLRQKSIYVSPASGGRGVVVSDFKSFWAQQGWENGRLGYPVAEEYVTAGGTQAQRFQGGLVEWTTHGIVVH
jgi:uncharacterized protein with LGFP repeats